MEFTAVVRKRRAIRRYSQEPVDPEAFERILDAGTRGPSAGYSQGQSFIAVTSEEMKQKLDAEWTRQMIEIGDAIDPAGGNMFYNAPNIIIACTNEQEYHRRYQQPDKLTQNGLEITWPAPYWYVDSGCGIMLLLLAAVNEGLAACLIGVPFHVQPWKDILGMPSEVMPVGTVLVGHRAEDEVRRDLSHRRKPYTDYIHRDRW